MYVRISILNNYIHSCRIAIIIMHNNDNHNDDKQIIFILNNEHWVGVMSGCVHEGFPI